MEILQYQLDITSLLNKQDESTKKKKLDDLLYENQGKENKLKLLKYVLPYVHGVLALHNHKCDKKSQGRFGGEYLGLQGYGKRDIQKELDYIANESDFSWRENYSVFEYKVYGKKIGVWLNKHGKHIETPNLPYSMTSFVEGKIYGDSIESELEAIATFCGTRFIDDWE